MFINELPVQQSMGTSRMSSYIYTFLNAEVTCIPGEISKILENYYSNAHCNGATWLFFLWNVLHFVYDKCLHAFLRRLKFKQHVCTRIKDSLWYLGFHGTALVYCSVTLVINDMELFNFKRMHVPSDTKLSNQVILGYTLVCTFYLHSAFWEGIKNGSLTYFIKYLFLAFLSIFSYILRVLEIIFSLTGLISITQVATEVTRLTYSLSKRSNYLTSMITIGLFIVTLALYVVIHAVVIPLTFAVPLGLKILSDYPNILLIFLYLSLLVWLIVDIYKSVLYNFFDHWLYHSKGSENVQCPKRIGECALFLPRSDDAYHLQILRREMKERQQEMISKRKPKNRSMLVQTLKCMVAIKRKLNEKRMSDSSDSEDSEKSEEIIKNKDVDVTKYEKLPCDDADRESDSISDHESVEKDNDESSDENDNRADVEDNGNSEDSSDEISLKERTEDINESSNCIPENILSSDNKNVGRSEENLPDLSSITSNQ